MFFRVMCTVAALGFVALIALQNSSAVNIRFFSQNVSVPVAVMVCCFLILGFSLGMIWRRIPKNRRGKIKNQQVPVIANLKVCK